MISGFGIRTNYTKPEVSSTVWVLLSTLCTGYQVLQVDIMNKDRYQNNKHPRTLAKLNLALSIRVYFIMFSFAAFKYVNSIIGREKYISGRIDFIFVGIWGRS